MFCLHLILSCLLCSENTARYWKGTKKSVGVGETSLPWEKRLSYGPIM